MRTSLRAQLLSLLPALLLGMGLGLAYDLLRPPRRRCGPLLAGLLDLLFALFAAGTALLCTLKAAGDGGAWMWGFLLAGFLFYFSALSPLLLPLLELLFQVISNMIQLFKNFEKNLTKSAKKIFPKAKDWIIMKR